MIRRDEKMYTLYYKRFEKAIVVSKAKKVFQTCNFTEEVTRYNDCYFLCSKRKPLIDKANEIKQGWISELEEELSLVKEIKI
jgi:hypothetical protein